MLESVTRLFIGSRLLDSTWRVVLRIYTPCHAHTARQKISQDFAEFCRILSILPSPALPLLRHREAIVCCLLARRKIPIRPRPASSSSGLAQAFCALQHQHSDGDEELDSMVPEPRVDLQHQARRFGRPASHSSRLFGAGSGG
jgi:hypothetical protein